MYSFRINLILNHLQIKEKKNEIRNASCIMCETCARTHHTRVNRVKKKVRDEERERRTRNDRNCQQFFRRIICEIARNVLFISLSFLSFILVVRPMCPVTCVRIRSRSPLQYALATNEWRKGTATMCARGRIKSEMYAKYHYNQRVHEALFINFTESYRFLSPKAKQPQTHRPANCVFDRLCGLRVRTLFNLSAHCDLRIKPFGRSLVVCV